MNTIKAYWFVFSLLVRTTLPEIPAKKRAEKLLGNIVKLLLSIIAISFTIAIGGVFIGSEKVLVTALTIISISLFTFLIAVIVLVFNDDRK